ncbi:MAG: transcription elongation factor Spt5 [Archaeoglobaceae archaeon]|nr:transcription elongation factor Spt5 [Archaeoglobaceae archaeon]MCX8151885.1 transcription elongation factor Spt5 [Archaeoglobaceae archaeon]MDW8013274.1 transcription elongation factor Spt5 [Archaeoglobaceae archaeon]
MSKFYAVKTTANQERIVANLLEMYARKNRTNVYSILEPKELKGYVIVEAESYEDVVKTVKGLSKVKGVVKREISTKEIDHFLAPKKIVEKIKEGDMVEIVYGPFKGESAIVRKVDEVKNEITIELINAVVPIPVTVKADHARKVERR